MLNARSEPNTQLEGIENIHFAIPNCLNKVLLNKEVIKCTG